MKKVLLILSISYLSACTTNYSKPSGLEGWETHGYEQAKYGNKAFTEEEIKKSGASESEIKAYKEGYEKGKSEYCNISPALLKKSGDYYMEICDPKDIEDNNSLKVVIP
jgi:hypothetical protein